MKNSDLKQFLADSTLHEYIDKYLYIDSENGNSARSRYKLFMKRLSAKRFVLPVAGVQGSGKSTFLNALAFEEPVLPVDADETTCVPVEIRWGCAEEGRVVFQDGREESIIQNEQGLNQFVHNEYNPGNGKKVDRIILFSQRSFFEKGLVLVDLPGTGSLTADNMETTRSYLDEALGVIFMLRTVPPLTQSESIFVAMQWARLPSAFFIQNRWNDESDAEATGGKEHNVKVLTDLARRNHIPLDDTPRIHLVNAYRAHQGILCNDAAHVKASGIEDFVKVLNEVGVGWPEILSGGIYNVLKKDVDEAFGEINVQLEQLVATKEYLEAELEENKKRFEAYIEKVKDKSAKAIKESRDKVEKISDWLDQWANDSRSTLRNNMRTKLRMGIVDGPRLERALRDEESVVADEAFSYVQEEILGVSDLIQERFKDVVEWSVEKKILFESVKREEKTKYENVIPDILSAGGGLGGAYYGGSLGLAIGGPAGSFIGVVIGGFLGGLFGTWSGGKARKVVVEQRAKKVEAEVFAAVTRFVKNMNSDLQKQIEQFQAHIGSFLLTWQQEQVNRFETEQQRIKSAINMKNDERISKLAQLNKDLEMVKIYRIKLIGDSK